MKWMRSPIDSDRFSLAGSAGCPVVTPRCRYRSVGTTQRQTERRVSRERRLNANHAANAVVIDDLERPGVFGLGTMRSAARTEEEDC